MIDERKIEILKELPSFSKELYFKNEILPELLKLQYELGTVTFRKEHLENANLKLWDVENYLKQFNKECDGIVDEELNEFLKLCGVLINMIKAEISGNRGENLAFRYLGYLSVENLVLKNIELQNEKLRSELDAVVITNKGIIIVEVKNTSKDIYIAEEGGYYRTGERLNWDCNIANKMADKEKLLRAALKNTNYSDVPIKKIVVFTNNKIEVHNKCKEIQTCFGEQLTYYIERFNSDNYYSSFDIGEMKTIIAAAEIKEAYPFSFDVNHFKQLFAYIVATLEEASSIKQVINEEKSYESVDKDVLVKDIADERGKEQVDAGRSKLIKVGGIVATIILPIISGALVSYIAQKNSK